MKYQVMRIEEDLDFGCEERGADEPVMAVVVLKDENGTESRIRQEDQMLYDCCMTGTSRRATPLF